MASQCRKKYCFPLLEKLINSVRYLGIDYGLRRIGLSTGDDVVQIATPLPPIFNGSTVFEDLAAVIAANKIGALVMGLPLRDNGKSSEWTKKVRDFGDHLAQRFALPVHWSDECLTSYQIDQDRKTWGLREPYKDRIRMRRSGKLDSLAAVLILQDFFEARRLEEV